MGRGKGCLAQPSDKGKGSERGRSRSSVRGAEPLRRGAPYRRNAARAALPQLDDRGRAAALEALDRDIYAASTVGPRESRLRTVTTALGQWGLTPWPLDLVKVRALAASLKEGSYRSAGDYMRAYTVEAERAGQTLNLQLRRAVKDYERSCERGLGPSVRPRPLPFDRLSELPGGAEPWTAGGPVGPTNAIIVGSWWMTREIELSTARAALVEVIPSTASSPLFVRWHLPASKTDQRAEGVARTHRCRCQGKPFRGCPAHCVWDQLLVLQRLFPDKWVDGVPAWDLPLFPTSAGSVCFKADMQDTITAAAQRLAVPLSAPDYSERVSGHSLRVTGAQGLARLGWELWAIQLMGRWGSETVKHYVQEALLDFASSRLPARLVDLEEMVAQRRESTIELSQPKHTIEDGTSKSPSVKPPTSATSKCSSTSNPSRDPAPAPDTTDQTDALAVEVQAVDMIPGPTVEFVRNAVTQFDHMVNRAGPSQARRSRCGWHCDRAGRALPISAAELGHAKFGLCDKCFPPSQREMLWAVVGR